MTAPGSRQQVEWGTRTIDFEVVREDRRSFRVDVHPDLRVVVHAPADAAADQIRARVVKRARWIHRQLDYFAQFQPLPPPRRYVSGESHYYLGRQYRLKLHAGSPSTAKLIGRFLHVTVPEPGAAGKVEERVQLWYRQHARRIFAARTAQCHERLREPDVPLPEVKLRRMKNRWGSYARPGTIMLNTELVKAPLYCIEYVIMHELCHLRHPHHGPQFWALLQRSMPDWRQRKQKLELAIL